MKTMQEYLHGKRVGREIAGGFRGLDTLYKFMTDEEKEMLKFHKNSISYDKNVYDLKEIKLKYDISWNELRYMIIQYC